MPCRPTRVTPRLIGKTAKRGLGKLMTSPVEIARVTESEYSSSVSARWEDFSDCQPPVSFST